MTISALLNLYLCYAMNSWQHSDRVTENACKTVHVCDQFTASKAQPVLPNPIHATGKIGPWSKPDRLRAVISVSAAPVPPVPPHTVVTRVQMWPKWYFSMNFKIHDFHSLYPKLFKPLKITLERTLCHFIFVGHVRKVKRFVMSRVPIVLLTFSHDG